MTRPMISWWIFYSPPKTKSLAYNAFDSPAEVLIQESRLREAS